MAFSCASQETDSISSMIYEHLRAIQPPEARVGIACIYCDSQQQHVQVPQNLLASLWPPLHLDKDQEPPAYIQNFYRTHAPNRTRPDLYQIQFVIQSAINQLEKAYILIDGLDECSSIDQQETLAGYIQGLLANSNVDKVKVSVLVTSRLEQRFLDGTSVEIEAKRNEIAAMVEKRINTPRSFRHSLRPKIAKNEELRGLILEQVVTRAKGMFLIADLHMKSLGSITNVRDLRAQLDKLPETLDQYYEVALARIGGQEEYLKDIAHRAMSWVYLSQRQLQMDELRHALATQPGDRYFSDEGLIPIEDVLDTCKGLVVVEQHSHVVRLMHATVREFFERQHGRLFNETADYLTRTCLTYLCLDYFDGEPCHYASIEYFDKHAGFGEERTSRTILSLRLSEYPFLDYTAKFWGYHARGAPEKSCSDHIKAFLCNEALLRNAHVVHPQVFHPSLRRHVTYDRIFEDLNALRVAIAFGLQHTACSFVKASLKSLADLQEEDRKAKLIKLHMLKALLEAIETGQLSVVEALLDAGVNPSSTDELPQTILDRTFLYPNERPSTALDKSVFHGHDEVSSVLMRRGFGDFITPTTLDYAVFTENTALLSLYFSTAPTQSQQRKMACYVLQLAATKGRLNIVRFTLDQGAQIESTDMDQGCTALGLAVMHGQSDVVQYLLAKGADVEAEVWDDYLGDGEDSDPKSMLQVATTSQRVFRNRLNFLHDFVPNFSSADVLDQGTEQFKKSLTSWLALEPRPSKLLENQDFLATIREDAEHPRIISMLLDWGADSLVLGPHYETFLHFSVISKSRVEIFLEHYRRNAKADVGVDSRDDSGRTPLHYAAAICNAEVMETLIRAKADVSAKDHDGITPLYYATDDVQCIRILIREGCRFREPHEGIGTPLQFAKSLEYPNVDVIRELEKLSAEATEPSRPDLKARRAETDLPNADSRRVEEWIDLKLNEHEVLSKYNLRRYLTGSQQESFVKETAI